MPGRIIVISNYQLYVLFGLVARVDRASKLLRETLVLFCVRWERVPGMQKSRKQNLIIDSRGTNR